MNLLKMYYRIRISVFSAIISIIEERYVNYIKTLRGIVTMSGLAKDRVKEQGVKTAK